MTILPVASWNSLQRKEEARDLRLLFFYFSF
jgi:hypothetical protein